MSNAIAILVHILSTFFQKSTEKRGKKRKRTESDHAGKALWHKAYGENLIKRGKTKKIKTGRGNNPMVGATVAVAVAVAEAVK